METKTKNRWRYAISKIIIQNLLNQNLITKEEFEEIDKLNLESFAA